MPVRPAPTTSAVNCPGEGGRSCRASIWEPSSTLVSVDVEGIAREAGDLRADETAAEGEYQPVVRQLAPLAPDQTGSPPVCKVDVDYFGHEPPDSDWFQHIIERNPDAAQIGLVIPHADRVPGIAIDHRHFGFARADLERIERTRRADRAPQTGEPAAENKNARHGRAPQRGANVTTTPVAVSSGCANEVLKCAVSPGPSRAVGGSMILNSVSFSAVSRSATRNRGRSRAVLP